MAAVFVIYILFLSLRFRSEDNSNLIGEKIFRKVQRQCEQREQGTSQFDNGVTGKKKKT